MCDRDPRYRGLRIRKVGEHLWARGTPWFAVSMLLFCEVMLSPLVKRGFGVVAQHLTGPVLPERRAVR